MQEKLEKKDTKAKKHSTYRDKNVFACVPIYHDADVIKAR